jgi:hypothetical protein
MTVTGHVGGRHYTFNAIVLKSVGHILLSGYALS